MIENWSCPKCSNQQRIIVPCSSPVKCARCQKQTDTPNRSESFTCDVSPEVKKLLDDLKAAEPGLTNTEILRRAVKAQRLPGRLTNGEES